MIKKFVSSLFILSVCIVCADAKIIQDSLDGNKINKKIWKTSMTGTVTCDSDGVILTSGPNEEAVRLSLKKKVNPDDYYRFEAEIFPTKEKSNGFGAFINAPGWTLFCGSNGKFWIVSKHIEPRATGPNPLGKWYKILVINRPGVSEITITDDSKKVVKKWTLFKDPGLSTRIAFGAVAGNGRKGPREMRVRNVKLDILPLTEFVVIPENKEACCKSLKDWKIDGEGKLSLDQKANENQIKAKFKKSCTVFYTFPKPLELKKIHSVKFAIKMHSEDEMYNLQYFYKSKNGGVIFFNDLNRGGGFDWENKVFYPDFMGSHGQPDVSNIIGFGVTSLFVEKDSEICLKDFQMLLEPDHELEKENE